MTFANTLSLRFLIVCAALSLSGCNQPLPGQLKNGATSAQAGAAAAGTAAKTQKTATGQNTNAPANMNGSDNAAGSAKSGDMSSAAAGGQARTANASGAAGAAAAATPAKNAKAVPVCEGKADEYACDERTLYHCVNGLYEGKPQSCKNAAQCGAGLTTGQCGKCDPGTFLCNDLELQRCDETGTYVMEAQCASAKLCKEEIGICDTQICHQDEYHCNVDQLQICNRDLSDFENTGRPCEPGLCSVKAQSCLECLPDSPATCANERSISSCTADGMLKQTSCAADTPFCAEGKCVQCNTAADCGQAMNDCGTLVCNAGMCAAGDPKPKGTACSSNGGKMCDYLGSCVTCVTDLDCNDAKLRCYLGIRCATKDAVTATPLLSSWSVVVSPGFKARVTPPASPLVLRGATTNTLNSSQAADATYLLSVDRYSACGFTQVASDAGQSIALRFSEDAATQMTGFPTCVDTATVTLTAEKN